MRLQGQCGGHRCARDQVVPAGVPDVRERIVFHAQRYGQFAAARARGERCGQPAGAAFNLEAAFGQQCRRRLGGTDLLEGDLLRGVDFPRHGLDAGLPVFDAGGKGRAERRQGGA
ncbi:hypothetical protein D9M72_467510 [compost metagenome]